MIDLRAARNDPEGYRAALARKGAAELFDELLAADVRKRELQTAGRGAAGADEAEGQADARAARGAAWREGASCSRSRPSSTRRRSACQALLDRVPNPPAEDTPDGDKEEDAVDGEASRRPAGFDFEPRDHLDLAAAHGWIDVERGAKVSGSRFVYRVGDIALLELALYRWALDRITQKGHVPVLPPVLVREEAMYGTGFFPSDKGDFY